MIGGGGRKRTLRTAAIHADEWNYWGMPAISQNYVRCLTLIVTMWGVTRLRLNDRHALDVHIGQ